MEIMTKYYGVRDALYTKRDLKQFIIIIIIIYFAHDIQFFLIFCLL